MQPQNSQLCLINKVVGDGNVFVPILPKESCYVAVWQQKQGFAVPLVSGNARETHEDLRQSERAMDVRNGIFRGFSERNWAFLPELTLANGRRADLTAIDQDGTIRIFEIKSSIEDFRADSKWQGYKDYCDAFYFATLSDVPAGIFPGTEGFVIADRHGCEIMREAEIIKLPPATRKAVTLRFARAAADRLNQIASQQAIPLTDGAGP